MKNELEASRLDKEIAGAMLRADVLQAHTHCSVVTRLSADSIAISPSTAAYGVDLPAEETGATVEAAEHGGWAEKAAAN